MFGSASPTASPSAASVDLDFDPDDGDDAVDARDGVDIGDGDGVGDVPREVAAAPERLGGGRADVAVAAAVAIVTTVVAAGVLP